MVIWKNICIIKKSMNNLDFYSLSTYADIFGILASILAGISWYKARKHSRNASQTLSVIRNYKTIEIFTETNKKIDLIKEKIRSIKNGTNIKRLYSDIEKVINDIINDIPTEYTELIKSIREIERTIQSYSDKNEHLIDQEQYKILDKIDTIKTGTKIIVESLRQGI